MSQQREARGADSELLRRVQLSLQKPEEGIRALLEGQPPHLGFPGQLLHVHTLIYK